MGHGNLQQQLVQIAPWTIQIIQLSAQVGIVLDVDCFIPNMTPGDLERFNELTHEVFQLVGELHPLIDEAIANG